MSLDVCSLEGQVCVCHFQWTYSLRWCNRNTVSNKEMCLFTWLLIYNVMHSPAYVYLRSGNLNLEI